MNYLELLREFCACAEALNWYDQQSSEQAWLSCERGDWMLWIASKLNVDRKIIVLAACDCVETSLQYITIGENRPRVAIEAARGWAVGTATIEDVKIAADAAAAAAYAAHAVAAHAAAHAADAATAAADAATAADADADACTVAVVADAAAAAAYAADAAYGTWADAKSKSLLTCAKIVRQRISWPIIEKALQEFGVAND